MPDGGRLTLRVTAVGPRPRRRARRSAETSVCFSVEDTGHGMSANTREHATEPFFTTKVVGEGSGLGLSMVYGFANQSGGRLHIHSELGAGTKIELYLPETQLHIQSAGAADETSALPATGRVLVVEDDDLIRSQVERQLRSLGHTVTVTCDGPEAIRALSGDQTFDLLITDVVMPNGMNGRELAQRARSLAPGMRILLTSGHNEDAFLRGGEGHGGDDFLPKPYRRADLERTVSSLLRRPARTRDPDRPHRRA
jgi:CheY-like chemotaxis protein